MKIGIKVNTDQLDCLQIWFSFNFSILVNVTMLINLKDYIQK